VANGKNGKMAKWQICRFASTTPIHYPVTSSDNCLLLPYISGSPLPLALLKMGFGFQDKQDKQ
jgi:hypothetical protein